MPMISLTTSAEITSESAERLKAGFGQAISLLPGKSEAWLMVSLKGDTAMYFQGAKRDAAFVDVSCYGSGRPEAYGKLTGAVCDLLQTELGLDPANVYVKYSETPNWGWNGGNF